MEWGQCGSELPLLTPVNSNMILLKKKKMPGNLSSALGKWHRGVKWAVPIEQFSVMVPWWQAGGKAVEDDMNDVSWSWDWAALMEYKVSYLPRWGLWSLFFFFFKGKRIRLLITTFGMLLLLIHLLIVTTQLSFTFKQVISKLIPPSYIHWLQETAGGIYWWWWWSWLWLWTAIIRNIIIV